MNDKDRINCPLMDTNSMSQYLNQCMSRIDEDTILAYDGEEFVKGCYQFFFNRPVDPQGMKSSLGLLNDGLSKEGYLYYLSRTEEFRNRFKLKKEAMYRREYLKYSWDVGYLLQLNGWDFLKGCYGAILMRRPDKNGVIVYSNLYGDNMPKEAILYLIASSEEAKSVKSIRNLDIYKSIYEDYMQALQHPSFKRRVKNKIKYIFERITHSHEILKNQLVDHALLMLTLEESASYQKSMEDKITTIVQRRANEISYKQDVRSKKLDNSVNDITNDIAVACMDIRNEIDTARFEMRSHQDELLKASNLSKTTVQGYSNGVTCIQVGEFLMGIPSEEWRLAMYLSKYNAFEIGTEQCFKNHVQSGMQVLDIGANLGIFTLHALSLGCKVHSFEPTPHTFHLLHENIGVNGYADSTQVELHQCAVSNKQGTCEFTTYTDVCGHNSMFGDKKDNSETITVPMITIDETLETGTQVDMVKIDVEGAEPLVLEGMQRVIRENPQMQIIMEFAPIHLRRAGFNPGEFLERIRKYGFIIQAINDFTGDTEEVEDSVILDAVSVNLYLSRKEEV